MTLREYWRLIRTLPPHITVWKAWLMFRRWGGHGRRWFRQRFLTTYGVGRPPEGVGLRLFAPLPLLVLRPIAETLATLTDGDLAHEFDVLGSGPVRVAHGAACGGLGQVRFPPGPGVIPDADGAWLRDRILGPNLRHAQRLWGMVQGEYRPLDWQLDFKSGFRWSERRRSERIHYGETPGVDIKTPWELGRMQHLVRLAQAHAMAVSGAGGFRPAWIYVQEFRNQVLDFMAGNPPGFGVQWGCAMDVGIRAANWVVAHDLMRSHGAVFDMTFETALARGLYDHGRHIIDHLEWFPELRSNHYLANVAGLIFIAAYLPRSREVDAWLAFGAQELVREVLEQFHEDGSNFEAATGYHLLSGEMAVYATAALLGLSADKRAALRSYERQALKLNGPTLSERLFWNGDGFGVDAPYLPRELARRLRAMARFNRHLSLDTGLFPTIGDHDSGHFLLFDGNLADLRALTAAIHALFDEPSPLPGHWIGAAWIREHLSALRDERIGKEAGIPYHSGYGAYTGMGLYVYRQNGFHGVVRAGEVGQRGHGGHAHNDQLSLTLAWGGVPFLVDRGSYLYTPDFTQRNLFRSTAMHNVWSCEGWEQNLWSPGREGLFGLIATSRVQVLEASTAAWHGRVEGLGAWHERRIQWGMGGLEVAERFSRSHGTLHFHLSPDVRVEIEGLRVCLRAPTQEALELQADSGQWMLSRCGHASGYGHREEALRLDLMDVSTEVHWRVRALGDG